MDIFEKMSAKQFLIILIIGGYILFKTTFITNIFSDIYERFNVLKKLKESNNKNASNNLNKNNANTNTNLITETKLDDSDIIKINTKKDNDNDMYCNKKNELVTIEDKLNKCLLNNTLVSNNSLKPINYLAYNYDTNLNNNILYSINNNYKNEKIRHEKKMAGDITANNQYIIHKNFDKNLDNFKLIKRLDTILNLNDKTSSCFVKDLERFQKTLKCLLRIDSEIVSANWNIPILSKFFFPGNIVIAICNSNTFNLKKADIYEIPFVTKSKKYESDCFSLNTYFMNNRIMYSLKSEKERWIKLESKCIEISIKIYFFFKFYDDKKQLTNCYMESNEATLK